MRLSLKINSWKNGNTQFTKWFFIECLPKPSPPDTLKFHLIFRDLKRIFSATHISNRQCTHPQSYFPEGNARTCGCPSCYGDHKALGWSPPSRALRRTKPAAAGFRTWLPYGFCSCQTRDPREGPERRAGWEENSTSFEKRGKEKQTMGEWLI